MRSAGAGFAAVTAGPVPPTELPPAGRHDTHLLSSLSQAVLPPPNPAGQESRRRPEDKIQSHRAAAVHKQAPFGVSKKEKKFFQIIPLLSTFKTAAQFHTVILA